MKKHLLKTLLTALVLLTGWGSSAWAEKETKTVKTWDFTSQTENGSISSADNGTVKITVASRKNITCNLSNTGLTTEGLYFWDAWKLYTTYLRNVSSGDRIMVIPNLKANDVITFNSDADCIIASSNSSYEAYNSESSTYTITVTADGNVGLGINKNINIYKIAVSREVDTSSCENPTYSITGASYNKRLFSLACETEGATIYYSETELEADAEGWKEYANEVTTSSATIYAYAKTSDAKSEVISFSTGAGSTITLNSPTITLSGMASSGDYYYPILVIGNDQSTLEVVPASTALVYEFNDEVVDGVNPYTFGSTGTLTVTVSAEGYTSSSANYTVANGYIKEKTIDLVTLTADNLSPVWKKTSDASQLPAANWISRYSSAEYPLYIYDYTSESASTSEVIDGLIVNVSTASTELGVTPTLYVGAGMILPTMKVNNSDLSASATWNSNIGISIDGGTAEQIAVYTYPTNYGQSTNTTAISANENYSLYRFSDMLTKVEVYSPKAADDGALATAKEELLAVITYATSIEASELSDAISTAQTAYDATDATVESVGLAKADLVLAVKQYAKGALQPVLELAEEITENSGELAEGIQPFKTELDEAIETAKAALNDEEKTPEEIMTALETLSEKALVFASVTLDAAIVAAKAIDTEGKNEAEALASAITAAEAAIAAENPTIQGFYQAGLDLKQAIDDFNTANPEIPSNIAELPAEDGWNVLTELPENLGDYYYALVDNDGKLMLTLARGQNQSNAYNALYYKTAANALVDKSMLFTLEAFDNCQVMTNAEYNGYFLQTEYNAAHFYRTHDNGGGSKNWGKIKFVYSTADRYWTVQNGQYPVEDGNYLGVWNDNTAPTNGLELALNKPATMKGTYQLYAISKQAAEDYYNQVKTVADYTEGNPVDMTALIVNPNANYWTGSAPFGWTTTGTQNINAGVGPDNFPGIFEYSNWNASSWEGSLKQTIDVPNGLYELKAYFMAAEGVTAYLTANEDESDRLNAFGDNPRFPQQLSVQTKVNTGTIEIGTFASASESKKWVNADNFTLTYIRELTDEEMAVNPTDIALDKTEATLTATDNTVTLKPTFTPENATATVTWTSSDESVATVADGVVTGVAPGTATITVTSTLDENVSASCEVTVSYPETEYELSNYTNDGATRTINALSENNLIKNGSFEYPDGFYGWTDATSSAQKLSSSNFEIVTAEDNHYLKAKGHDGSNTAKSIGTAWPIENGKTYVFGYKVKSNSAGNSEFHKVSLTNTLGTETKQVSVNSTAVGTGWTAVNYTFTNTENYEYVQFRARWLNSAVCFDDFYLAEATYSLVGNVEYATAAIPTSNIGTGAFQYSQDAINAANALVQGEATVEDVENAYTALTTLNAPGEEQLFNIVNVTNGFNHKGKALTFMSSIDADLTANTTSIGWLETPGSIHPQAIKFTPVEGVQNGYTMSYKRADGNVVYVSTGKTSGLGNSTQQIRPTTEASKALTFVVNSTGDNSWTLFNTEDGHSVGSNGDTGFFTAGGSNKDVSIQEAVNNEVSLTILAENQYATLIVPFDATVPAGIIAYSLSNANGNELDLQSVTEIKANTPYVVCAEGGITTTLAGIGAAFTENSYTTGWLTGVYAETAVPNGSYILQNHDGAVAFYRVDTGVATPKVQANHAYMTIPSGDGARAYYFGGEATAIGALKALTSGDAEIYDVNGRKQVKLQKGVNIIRTKDGRTQKVMVK